MITEKPFGTGAIHTTDSRDHSYVAGITPEILPIAYQTTPIAPLMQGQQESCVSHAFVRLLQFYWWKKTGKVIDFSPRFLHAYTSAGTQDADGRDPRQIAQVLTDIGCCTTAFLPNDTSLSLHDYSFAPITQEMLNEAAQYKIPAYSFINPDSYSIRHAIYHKGAVALLFHVGSEWWTPSYLPKDINPLRPPTSQTFVGGHEVTGEHWNTLEGIENSWSAAWDEQGYGEYDILNYAPLQAICIDDPNIDFNPFQFNKNLWFGQANYDVVRLQQKLNVTQTGYFGAITLAAVMVYQHQHGISPTGFCGPLTRASLNATVGV